MLLMHASWFIRTADIACVCDGLQVAYVPDSCFGRPHRQTYNDILIPITTIKPHVAAAIGELNRLTAEVILKQVAHK